MLTLSPLLMILEIAVENTLWPYYLIDCPLLAYGFLCLVVTLGYYTQQAVLELPDLMMKSAGVSLVDDTTRAIVALVRAHARCDRCTLWLTCPYIALDVTPSYVK